MIINKYAKLVLSPKSITVLLFIISLAITIIYEELSSKSVNSILNISGASSTSISSLLNYFDLGYSYIAGVLAAFNPCGIVMLPAYLGMYINSSKSNSNVSFSKKLTNASSIILFVGMGFILLFSIVAILISFSSNLVGSLIPYISILLSLIIIYFGVSELQGKSIFSTFITSFSSKIGNPGKTTPYGFLLFGISYGLASVGCALPIFVSMLTKTLSSTTFISPIIDFFLYSLGMISVIAILTIITVFSTNLTRKISSAFRSQSHNLFGIFLSFAGVFMLMYWLYDLKITL
ncbi:cytochrome c biogenesis protein CcdA [Dehalococcoidia bacterium]|jgi:cytochrome c biogenesis protein CcdA|nr:cytochrome c biogenesis protein CcdA [Dehalococcoidia bacterium]